MRRFAASLLALAFLLPVPAGAQDAPPDPGLEVEGRWEGALELPDGQALRILFEIERGEDGDLSATMYSPDPTPDPIPTGSTTFSEGQLTVEVPVVQGRYQGSLGDEGVLEGTWSQGAASLPLDLTRAGSGGGR